MTNISKLAMFVSSIKVASQARKTFTYAPYTKQNVIIAQLLLQQGCVRFFTIIYKLFKRGCAYLSIKIFLLYIRGSVPLIRDFKLVSKRGRRVFWTLNILFLNLSKTAFSGFYLLSTPLGICTSSDLVWRMPTLGKLAGEILVKISF